ncbi:peptidoglycan-binding domain-containing protein [Actinacidiphila guanduensis]|uniref:Putative peptidoglycan binding domain-containing protein n=1 Tax=Actinacidiphila guanduensis TaxID=310781 RepID=A0A1H0QPF6_9ACTN|nr:peptidoglycan-binding domain-containing protein [Actinacidiphila guanduensis]SDP19251.1 Putative peptidoglycan binding domain-containing protein [Actinacidiphila guanduensis]
MPKSRMGRPRTALTVAALSAIAVGGLALPAHAISGHTYAASASAQSAAPATTYQCNKTYYSGTAITEEGDTGSRVIEVQCQLYWRGYLTSDQVDGIFGPNTYKAVLKFQREWSNECGNQLSIDGVVGTYTWGALRSACPN